METTYFMTFLATSWVGKLWRVNNYFHMISSLTPFLFSITHNQLL